MTSVRDLLLRIFPSLDAREPLSFFFSSFLVPPSRGSTASTSSLSLRGSPHLSRRKRTIQSLAILLSRCLSRAPLERASSALCSRAGSSRRDSRTRSRCVSRRLLSFIAVGRARKSHAGGRVCATGPLTSYGHM